MGEVHQVDLLIDEIRRLIARLEGRIVVLEELVTSLRQDHLR